MEKSLFVVVKHHNQDYLLSEAFICLAENKTEAILETMEFCGEFERYAIVDCEEVPDYICEERSKESVARRKQELRKLGIHGLEQHDRSEGNVWHADHFEMPDISDSNPVACIVVLSTD